MVEREPKIISFKDRVVYFRDMLLIVNGTTQKPHEHVVLIYRLNSPLFAPHTSRSLFIIIVAYVQSLVMDNRMEKPAKKDEV